jgi:hypothetical protein
MELSEAQDAVSVFLQELRTSLLRAKATIHIVKWMSC